MKFSGKKAGKPASRPSPGPLATGVPVHCKFDHITPAAELKLYPSNYRRHPKRQLERMHLVIAGKNGKPGNGWRRPVVVSSLSGFVTKGNGTAEMAKRYGLDVPVEVQTYANKAEELRDLIADNRLTELAKDDDSLLRQLLSELDAEEAQLTGITDSEIKALIEKGEEVGAMAEAHELFEHYDYIVLFFKSELDLLAAHSHFQIEHVRKPRRKIKNVGIGRVIDGAEYLKRISAA